MAEVNGKILYKRNADWLEKSEVTEITPSSSLLLHYKMGKVSIPISLVLSALLVTCLANHHAGIPHGEAPHVFLMSNTFAPNSELVFDLNLVNLTLSDVVKEGNKTDECILDLRISSENRPWYFGNWKLELETTPKSFSKTIRLMTPTEEEINGEKLSIKIESTSCFKISREFELPVEWKEPLVYIRTSKKTVSPGEKVLIESLVMTREHRPYTGPLNLTILDKTGTTVSRWEDIIPEDGIVRREHRIPLTAGEGELTISVEIHTHTFNHTIKVKRTTYLCEKSPFKVSLRTPKYHTIHSTEEGKSRDLEINVVASLDGGLPVVGRVELEISLENSTKSERTPPEELSVGYKKISLKIDDVKKLIGLSPSDSLKDRKINILIHVEEIRPSNSEKSEKIRPESLVRVTKKIEVTFVDQLNTLFFNKHTSSYFSPGLPYIGHVMLTPVDETNDDKPVEREITVSVKQFTGDSGTPKVESISLKLMPNSYGEFSVMIPKEVKKIELEATMEEKETGKTIKARLENIVEFSNSKKDGHTIHVTLNQSPNLIYVGEKFSVTIDSTFPTKEMHWTITCQAMLVLSGTIVSPSPTTKHELTLEVPHNLSHSLSMPNFVAWTYTPSMEIVADKFYFIVEEKPERKLELSVKPEIVEIDSMVEITITGEYSTRIIPVITSIPISFDPKEMEIRRSHELERVSRYMERITHLVPVLCKNCSTFSSRAPDSAKVFNETNTLVLSNLVLFDDKDKPWPIPTVSNGTLDRIEPSSLNSIEEFLTSCWNSNLRIGKSGEMKFRMKIPKEASLYTISIFGLVSGKNLVATEKPVQVTASSKVLAELRHPDSVVSGEDSVLEVYLFNSEEKETKVDIEVKEKPGFKLTCLDGENEKEEKILRRQVVLKPKESKMLPVYIKSSKTAQEPLEITVEVSSEGVHHNLSARIPIKYEGREVVSVESITLDNFNGKQVISIDLPRRMEKPVENSPKGTVKIYGHPLGPAIERVCRKMDTPRILDERLKMNFIVSTNVLKLISNNTVFENLIETKYDESPFNVTFEESVDRDECISSARDSVEHVLNRRNRDGSYSMGSRDKGCICLTSTMLEEIIELRKTRSVRIREVEETAKWLTTKQSEDGSFVDESHRLDLRRYPLDMSNKLPLTARVVIPLVRSIRHMDISKETVALLEPVIKKAVEYIEKSILSGEHDKDALALTVASYALACYRSPITGESIKRRDRLMVEDGDSKFWRPEIPTRSGEGKEGCPSCVESTSYAIRTSLEMGDVLGSTPFVNYVSSQMKEDGIFETIMDTTVALGALTEFHRKHDIFHDHKKVNVNVKATLSSKEEVTVKLINPFSVGIIRFDNSNITRAGPMKIESEGEGVIIVQSIVEYNEATPSTKPTDFDLSVEVKTKDPEHLVVKICAVNLKKQPGKMHIAKLPLLTGYELDIEKIRNETTIILHQNETVYIFFLELPPSTSTCAEVELVKFYRVGSIESKYIELSSILDPSNSIFKPYKDESSETGIKKICPDCKC